MLAGKDRKKRLNNRSKTKGVNTILEKKFHQHIYKTYIYIFVPYRSLSLLVPCFLKLFLMSEAYLGPCQVSTIKLFCKNSPRLLVANFFRKKGLPSRNSQYNYECHSSLFQLIWIAFTNSVAMLENYFIFSLFQCFRSNFKNSLLCIS